MVPAAPTAAGPWCAMQARRGPGSHSLLSRLCVPRGLDRETDGEYGGIGAIFAATAHAHQPVLASAARHSCVSLNYRFGVQALRMLLTRFELRRVLRGPTCAGRSRVQRVHDSCKCEQPRLRLKLLELVPHLLELPPHLLELLLRPTLAGAREFTSSSCSPLAARAGPAWTSSSSSWSRTALAAV